MARADGVTELPAARQRTSVSAGGRTGSRGATSGRVLRLAAIIVCALVWAAVGYWLLR